MRGERLQSNATRRVLAGCLLWFSFGAALADYGRGVPEPTHDFETPSPDKVELGRALMFDKVLSGNLNISCGTCHHSMAATGLVRQDAGRAETGDHRNRTVHPGTTTPA